MLDVNTLHCICVDGISIGHTVHYIYVDDITIGHPVHNVYFTYLDVHTDHCTYENVISV